MFTSARSLPRLLSLLDHHLPRRGLGLRRGNPQPCKNSQCPLSPCAPCGKDFGGCPANRL
jgi:hypothetical protein